MLLNTLIHRENRTKTPLEIAFSFFCVKQNTRKNTQGPSRARRLLTNAFNRADSQKYGGHHEKTLLLSSNHINSLLSTLRPLVLAYSLDRALSLTPTTTNTRRTLRSLLLLPLQTLREHCRAE